MANENIALVNDGARRANLVLHCGANAVSREDLDLLPVPAPLGPNHRPVPHSRFLGLVEDALADRDLVVQSQAFGITKSGDRFFGVLQVGGKALTGAEDYGFVLGLRGSHDQTFARSISAGSVVFVCDNLAFSGDVVVKTRHTLNVEERLPDLVDRVVYQLLVHGKEQDEQYNRFRECALPDLRADAAITHLVREQIVLPSQVGRVIHEWDEPSYPEFAEQGRTVWRFFNAVTTALKPTGDKPSLPGLPERTIGLHWTCNQLVRQAA